MYNNLMIWFIFIGIGMALGDVLMKQWIVNGAEFRGMPLVYYVSALIVYCTSLTLFAYQLRVTPLSIAAILPILINIIVIFCIGLTFYNEKLSYYQLAGVGISLVALFFLSKG